MRGPILLTMAATRKVGDRSPITRVVAVALACGANASLFLLLWFSRSGGSPEVVAPAMIWISVPVLTPPPRAPPPPPDQPVPRAPAIQIPAPVVIAPSSETSTAITLPPIDWYAEGQRAARNAFPDNAQVKPDTQDSAPKVQEPGLSSVPHKAGDSERIEGGETITWINETCYISNRPVPPPTMAGEFQMLRPVCKVRSMNRRRSEKDAAGLKDEAALEEKPQPSDSTQPLPELALGQYRLQCSLLYPNIPYIDEF